MFDNNWEEPFEASKEEMMTEFSEMYDDYVPLPEPEEEYTDRDAFNDFVKGYYNV